MPEITDSPGEIFSSLAANFESLGWPLLVIGLVAGIFIGLAIAKVNSDRKK